jgi:hypothetical protein
VESPDTLNGRQAEEVTQYNCYTTERPKGYINRDCLPFIDSSSIEIHFIVNNYQDIQTSSKKQTLQQHYHPTTTSNIKHQQ